LLFGGHLGPERPSESDAEPAEFGPRQALPVAKFCVVDLAARTARSRQPLANFLHPDPIALHFTDDGALFGIFDPAAEAESVASIFAVLGEVAP